MINPQPQRKAPRSASGVKDPTHKTFRPLLPLTNLGSVFKGRRNPHELKTRPKRTVTRTMSLIQRQHWSVSLIQVEILPCHAQGRLARADLLARERSDRQRESPGIVDAVAAHPNAQVSSCYDGKCQCSRGTRQTCSAPLPWSSVSDETVMRTLSCLLQVDTSLR